MYFNHNVKSKQNHNNSNEISISLHASKCKKVPFNDNSNDFNANETNVSIVDMLQLLSPSKTKDAQTKRVSSNTININNTKRKKTPHKLKPQSKKPTKNHLQLHKSKKNIYLNNIDNPLHKQQPLTTTTNKSKSQRFITASASSSINKVTHNPQYNVYNNYQNIIIKNRITGDTVININNNYYHYQTVNNDNLSLKSKDKAKQTSSSNNKSKHSSTVVAPVKTPRNDNNTQSAQSHKPTVKCKHNHKHNS